MDGDDGSHVVDSRRMSARAREIATRFIFLSLSDACTARSARKAASSRYMLEGYNVATLSRWRGRSLMPTFVNKEYRLFEMPAILIILKLVGTRPSHRYVITLGVGVTLESV